MEAFHSEYVDGAGEMRAYDLSNLRVLIVDDSHHMRLILRQVLRSLGMRAVTEAADGTSALAAFRDSQADIIITDWEMEPMDGVKFTRSIRTADDSPNPYVPIIMLTGYAEIQRVHVARDAGINEYLAKPISARRLYGRLVNAVEHVRQFVRSASYAGPCRRRNTGRFVYNGPERRHARAA